MKRVLFLTCIGSLALALTAWGAPREKSATRSAKGRNASSARVVSTRDGGHHFASTRGGGHTVGRSASMRTSKGISAGRIRPSAVAHVNTSRGSRMEAARTRVAVNRERSLTRANTLRTNRAEAARLRSTQTARANARIGARTNLAVTRGRNLTVGRNVAVNRGTSAAIVNNWRSDRFRNATYTAFYNYAPQWRDRAWWTSHYSGMVFVLGGWWYWDAGYWYPAWGYDPYAYYPYDGPIYGYGNLTPDRIVENVQLALQQQGYYAGPIDGDLGPQMRGALAAFQADHGLAVTSAIDRPTIRALGLT
jgi:hypothetical protein